MGNELVTLLQSQEASLQPNFGLMALSAIPSIILGIAVLVTLVLAVTDRGLSGWARVGWAVLIVAVPVIGAVIYLVLRGRQRIPKRAKAGVATKSRLSYLPFLTDNRK
ncbi:DUF805 domain-containing protein [Arthrobacter sp. CJ23]|uniref:DUF805 domain-containing protein n=1 Tax=Arthrobacter sp. CJ23 TaxID=2972479 RepID=UPI00215BF552|nr:DUF805 domain-containing protein [Arthrobacter sp. CJ23]UVJ39690.1 DUF805 domain-containing protein [Arthrobacter sp. CJ23]